MKKAIEKLFRIVEEKKATLSFITAGGGVSLFEIFRIPGASRIMIEARMLYSEPSIRGFLQHDISEKFVSQEVADQLCRAQYLETHADICFGLTCALVSERARKGGSRGYLSV